jgi:hypothetical protein
LAALRALGFDASAGSQLRAVPTADGSVQSTPNAARITTEAVFLPLYPELTEPAVDRLADILTSLLPNPRKGLSVGVGPSPTSSGVRSHAVIEQIADTAN